MTRGERQTETEGESERERRDTDSIETQLEFFSLLWFDLAESYF